MIESGLILLICAVVAGGVLGGLLRGWSVLSRLHVLESAVVRLQKQYAAQEKWGTRNLRQQLEAELASKQPEARSVAPFMKFGGKHGVPR